MEFFKMGSLCNGCFKVFDKTLKCSRCGSSRYCSVDCQKKDWNNHKKSCVKDMYCNKINRISKKIIELIQNKRLDTHKIEKDKSLVVNVSEWTDTHMAFSLVEKDKAKTLVSDDKQFIFEKDGIAILLVLIVNDGDNEEILRTKILFWRNDNTLCE